MLIETYDIGAQAYEERIRAFLHEFWNQQVLPNHKSENIRAIVISGEASTMANSKLGDIALQLVGTEEVKLMKEIDPLEVVAHGAAVWAQLTQQHPNDVTTHSGNIVGDEQAVLEHQAARVRHGLPARPGHDEL
jgi:hypothetical protein